MENRSLQLKAPGLIAVLAMLVLCALAFPAQAMADDDGYIAHSKGDWGRTYHYVTVKDAIEDAYNGRVIVMDKDWDLGSASIDLADSKSVTIDMNGHRITSSNKDATFYLNEHASLKLTSSADAKDYAYRGYDNSINNWNDLSIKTSGLVTNTKDGQGNATGVHMEKESSVTLENVAVAGCGSGGIYTKEGCSITLSNASVSHCARAYTSKGGGAGIQLGASSTLAMSASHVDGNYCKGCRGGGIFAEKSTTITMEMGSTVSGNCAGFGGGGIYLNGTYFTLKSEDRTGTVAENSCLNDNGNDEHYANQSGGGIHVDAASGQNEGLIEGITVKDNYSAWDGGGIELDQRWTTVRDCSITGNYANYDGGGVCVFGGNNLLENCTITGNWCAAKKGSCEGGGVFVSYHYDVKMSGTCIVKGNTRNQKDSGNADDVFLSTLSGGTVKAYITGSLAEGSAVGVRTGYTSDRRIAKNFKPASKDCLFYDMSGYYVSYGSDEGGDAWQRHTTKEFAAKINGESAGKYRNGTAVTLVAPATKGDDKVFWYWSTQYTTGLYPVGDYITEKNMFGNALAFTMPQNEVDAAAVYATRATKVVIGVDAPVAGEALPARAEVYRADGIGGTQPFSASVTWYEVGEDGKRSDTAAAGVAKAGTKYAATITCAQSARGGLCFSKSFAAAGATVKTPSGGDGPAAESATVDGITGALTVVTAAFAQTDGEKPVAKGGKATVKMIDGGLEAGLGGGASEAAGVAALSDGGTLAQAEPQFDTAVLGEFDVSWTEGDANVVIVAPAKAGYNFCNWEGALEGWVRDDALGTVTVPYDEVGYIDGLVAVYTPVVTSAAVSLDVPVAGEALAAQASDVKVACSDELGTEVSFKELLGVDGFEVTWSPEATVAGYSTGYTALVELADGAEELVDVEKVVSPGATVTCNGTEATAAGFVVQDGKLCLALSFGETRAVKAVSVSRPEAVEVSFEDAAAGEWGLPKTVDVTLENGELAEGDVTWEAVEGFDANATGAQVLAAKGKVTSVAAADGSEVDTDGASLEVTATVKVAAPAKQASDDTDATTTTTASKKGTPSTGDVTWGGFAGLLAVATVCLVAARVSRREH